jgi:hypothetical protein
VNAGTTSDQAGVRWYEIRAPGSATPTVFQQDTFAPSDGVNRWMGSAAMDGRGNMALGYSASKSTSVFPSIRYTARFAGDPVNQMTQGEGSVVAGAGSQNGSYSRWGDYSAMSVDPSDDQTFWYTQEYYQASSAAGWQTRIGSFKLGPTVTTSPQGNWVGTYGSAGYDLAAWNGSSDLGYLPSASVSLAQGKRFVWNGNSGDVRALQSPDQSTRRAATYYDENEIRVQLNFGSVYSGNLRLYAVDWDSTARRETITVNGQTASLSSDFSQGAWVTVPINVSAGGSVTITVDRTAGANAVLSGIFLGDAGPPPTIPVSVSPQGNWVGTYGSAGYDLAAWNGSSDLAQLPNTSWTVAQGRRYVWDGNSSDVRALQSPDQSTRRAATYYDENQIRVQLNFGPAYSGNLRLYAVDWDSTARRETITVNGQTANLSSDFSQGAWVTVPINVSAGGSVTITVDRTAGANAVLSGIFLGDAGTLPTFSMSPQGDWLGTYGKDGYDLGAWNGASDLTNLPSSSAPATVNLAQGSRYVWDPNTTQTRALESPDGSIRKAAAYYDANQVRLQLNFSAPYNGNVHLYAVDWDSQGRRETMTVNGQVANLSSDFSQGAWVTVPINILNPAGGTVAVTVDRTAGPNAVVSGVFLG